MSSRARIPALYSDFRPQRTLNPEGYQANISAWRHALSRLAAHGRLDRPGSNSSALVLDLDASLPRALEHRQFGQPLALGTAVREAVAERRLVPLQDFLKSPQNVYHHGWAELPWNVVTWTLRQMGVVDPSRGEDRLPKGHFVIMENVEASGKELSDKMGDKTSRFDRIFTKAQFQTEFATDLVQNQRLSETDTDVLLRFLSRDRVLIDYDGHTIRVKGSGEHGGITEEDAAIASIKEQTANLRRQVDLLTTRIEEMDQAAKTAVVRKNRVSALAALKSKKLAESSLATRYATLSQLEEVAARIEQASDQVQLVRVMESSTGVLKSLNAQVGGAEKVDSVMDRLREQMGETEEVNAILAESSGPVVDESEVDAELEALETQERQKEEEERRRTEEALQAKEVAEAQRKLDELPQVPGVEERGREKEQTPTTETGIANLTMEERPMEAS